MMVDRDSNIKLSLIFEVILNTGETDYLELEKLYTAEVLIALGIPLQEDIIEEMFEELLQTVNQRADVIALQDMYLISSVIESVKRNTYDMSNSENRNLLLYIDNKCISSKIQLAKQFITA